MKRKPKKKLVKKRTLKKKILKKKTLKKKLIKKRVAKSKIVAAKKPKEKVIGIATHYFPKVRAAVIKLKAPLGIGDTVKIKGHTTDFTQSVASMQIDLVPIQSAKSGQEIGLLVNSRVRQGDVVYKA